MDFGGITSQYVILPFLLILFLDTVSFPYYCVLMSTFLNLVRGSLRKFLDTHELSTIIEISPLHFLKVLSLSIYATSHPPEPRFVALASVTVIHCTELPFVCCNHVFKCWKPLPTQSGLNRREQEEVIRVPGLDCKEDRSTAAQESLSENPLSNPLSKWHSWCNRMPLSPALGRFSRNFWRTLGRPTGLVTCNDLRIAARVLIVESPKHFTATIPLEWPSGRQWDCGTQRDDTLLTLI